MDAASWPLSDIAAEYALRYTAGTDTLTRPEDDTVTLALMLSAPVEK
jgi:hypothetical protein